MHALMQLGRDESHRQSMPPVVCSSVLPLQAACLLQTTTVNAMIASAQRRDDVRAETLSVYDAIAFLNTVLHYTVDYDAAVKTTQHFFLPP
jgi:hypothetical protein